MKTYMKKLHNRHIYLDIENSEISKLEKQNFDKLIAHYNKPLQVGVYSDNCELIDLLTKSGFSLKRKCYELEVSKSDLKSPLENEIEDLFETRSGQLEYEYCCKMLYDYYAKTHYNVSPLTANLDDFIDRIPQTVIYSKSKDHIDYCAFVEENEIAYLASFSEDNSKSFLNSLLSYMFSKYKYIFFEADDTDWLATQLRKMFKINNHITFDSYVRDK